jgi:hypothetical protein
MSFRLRAVLLLLATAAGLWAKDPDWQSATVMVAKYQLDSSPGVVGAGGSTTARGEFEFETADSVYRAQEMVEPRSRLRIAEGDKVQVAPSGKSLLLRLDGKTRKMKLVSTIAKSKK